MDIIVCIKEVPDTTEVKMDPKTNTLVRSGIPSIINPFDLYALEEGVRLKEKYGGTVTAITMGPPHVEKSMREAISLGADKAVILSDRKFAGADTWATSYTLAKGIEKMDYDLILFGKQAIDGDTAQVGPGVAAHLDIAQLTYVKKIEEYSEKDNTFIMQRMNEEGYDRVKIKAPAAVTVVKEINEPRVPSLRGKMKAKKAQIPVWTTEDIEDEENNFGLDGSPTQVRKVFTPPKLKSGEKFQGDPEEAADKIIELLQKRNILGG